MIISHRCKSKSIYNYICRQKLSVKTHYLCIPVSKLPTTGLLYLPSLDIYGMEVVFPILAIFILLTYTFVVIYKPPKTGVFYFRYWNHQKIQDIFNP